ncbi:transposase [Aminirod propionatiphilus]|uniref:Transposase n=1 Tax=Aminirod propionatiphilus TaxID=3415223 RepID=A0ACD1DXR9_9BACT|nr:transposase [Synergistota bacterium]
MELDGLKKNQALTLEGKRASINPEPPSISVRRPCDLLDLNRSSFYYANSSATETAENLEIMELIDGQYTCTPSYGSHRMTAWLRRQGQDVNRKRIGRLMGLTGIEGIGPATGNRQASPRTGDLSLPAPERRHRQTESGLEHRCHLPPDERRFHVPRGRHRWAQPLRPLLETLQHSGRRVLRRRPRQGSSAGNGGELQHRPGMALHP